MDGVVGRAGGEEQTNSLVRWFMSSNRFDEKRRWLDLSCDCPELDREPPFEHVLFLSFFVSL
eukprot:scaffold4986_cov180-Alexandrium_tamarense.AAC.3